ncbi:MAG TPA: hypothetical protein VK927_12010, partial [Adhaeribacter sp.]|nr:hypothetical protein [Adhaeribacter sp.]
EKYIEGCREQTLYLNKKILAAVKNIKKKSSRPTIIILQGDHGPGAYFSHKSLENSNIEERFSNLNAVYFSDRNLVLPPDLSAVNTFRYILNSYFSTKLPILPNRQYYSPALGPCSFTEVTEAYEQLTRKNKNLPLVN